MIKSFDRQKKIEELKIKHSFFELSLKKEYNKPFFDDLKILNIKKQKLNIKDQINIISDF